MTPGRFLVVARGFDGKVRERVGGFTDRPAAEREAVRLFGRTDIGSVVVSGDVPPTPRRSYR